MFSRANPDNIRTPSMPHDRLLPKPALYYDYSRRDVPTPESTTPLAHRVITQGLSSGFDSEENLASPRASQMTGMEAISHVALCDYKDNISVLSKLPVLVQAETARSSMEIDACLIKPETAHQECSTSPYSPKSDFTEESNVQFCLCGPEPKIPRPRNAFILFRQHLQSSVVAENPGLPNPDISKIIGKIWKGLPLKDQEPWKKHADEEKARHLQKYPGYRYQPRRPGRKRRNTSTVGPTVKVDISGTSICSRCGGKPMKPPSTPSTPFIPNFNDQMDNVQAPPSHPEEIQHTQGRRLKLENIPSPINATYEESWRPAPLHDESIPPQSPCIKRRRSEEREIYPSIRHHLGPDDYLSKITTLPRPELTQRVHSPNYIWGSQSHYSNSVPASPHDPSLVLPPLKIATPSYPHGLANLEEQPKAVSFLDKIRLLSKGSPPFASCSTPESGQPEGAVIAIEGYDSESVACVTEYLNNSLSCDDGGNVRIFKRPESGNPTASEDTRKAAGNFLETIFSWYKISGTIIEFLNDRFLPAARRSTVGETGSRTSLQSILPKTEDLSICSTERSASGETIFTPEPEEAVHTPTSSSCNSDSTFRVALVPHYQLATTESHVNSTPRNRSHDLTDYWERMAMQWGSCVGPDITVFIQDCDQAEMNRYGSGNPVENRLNDVRTLVIRRLAGSTEGIDERALRRVGFEVKEFLRK
ncbi:HMG-box transcription factor [Nannizzia gypsea CBS 118893]|uniref:HMG-box transcription factor n=1 Tax=Arthroderma gypseum (strain ATCC MYA-4604 / CBS 118893) TaxID=535722 RepID=E4V1G0_ARTGP|nr:HMG-box transcription factor [Nannizzia gypsea CBS 118893]EFR03875.1 HMG-box transcription factor [Nannizzia gypsea CBS 118893]